MAPYANLILYTSVRDGTRALSFTSMCVKIDVSGHLLICCRRPIESALISLKGAADTLVSFLSSFRFRRDGMWTLTIHLNLDVSRNSRDRDKDPGLGCSGHVLHAAVIHDFQRIHSERRFISFQFDQDDCVLIGCEMLGWTGWMTMLRKVSVRSIFAL